MAATMWGKVEAGQASDAPATTTATVPAVELRMNEATEACETESGSAVLSRGIRSLYEKKEFCDLVLVVAGERLPAHKSLLAAISSNFRDHLLCSPGAVDPMQGVLTAVAKDIHPQQPADSVPIASAATTTKEETAPVASEAGPAIVAPVPPIAPGVDAVKVDEQMVPVEAKQATQHENPQSDELELQVSGVSTVESMNIMLSYIYGVGTGAEWNYAPSDADVNKDVLRLARSFGLPHLHEFAARWLTKSLTTQNVVERLVTCEEFQLMALREKIIEQLTANPTELTIVTSSPEIIKHPKILQDLLMQVASLCGVAAHKKLGKAEKNDKQSEKADKHDKVEEPAEEEAEEQAQEPEPAKKVDKKQEKQAVKVEKIEKADKVDKVPPQLEKPAAKRLKRAAAGA